MTTPLRLNRYETDPGSVGSLAAGLGIGDYVIVNKADQKNLRPFITKGLACGCLLFGEYPGDITDHQGKHITQVVDGVGEQ